MPGILIYWKNDIYIFIYNSNKNKILEFVTLQQISNIFLLNFDLHSLPLRRIKILLKS